MANPSSIMKTSLKLTVAAMALLISGALVFRSPAIQAQQPEPQQAAVPVVVNAAPTQYKVIDIGTIAVAKGRTPAATLEAILNEMGAQGWKVAATSGNYVILMQ